MHPITRALATAGVAAGAVLLTSGPAIARTPPVPTVPWHEVGATNANWKCGTVVDHPAGDGIRFRACIVRNSKEAQAVLVLVNNSGARVQIHGETNTRIWTNFGGGAANKAHVKCASSLLNTGFQVGCFSTSESTLGVDPLTAEMRLNINGHVKSIEYTRDN